MRICYVNADEVNLALATRLAATWGAVICPMRPGERPPAGRFDAALYDLDCVPGDQLPAVLEELGPGMSDHPRAVHGYCIADAQAKILHRYGVAVARRLDPTLFRRLCKAARRTCRTVSSDDPATELTWVNLVK
jgi:hypothetical protein